MSFELDVYQMHQRGRLDPGLVQFFLPEGQIRSTEGPMWDYKTGFCHENAVIETEPALISELLKDITSMYNAFGGYLIIAYLDAQASNFKKLVKNDEFNNLTDRYLKTRIPIVPFPAKASVNGKMANVLFLHIAK